jgi:hypothetical protein
VDRGCEHALRNFADDFGCVLVRDDKIIHGITGNFALRLSGPVRVCLPSLIDPLLNLAWDLHRVFLLVLVKQIPSIGIVKGEVSMAGDTGVNQEGANLGRIGNPGFRLWLAGCSVRRLVPASGKEERRQEQNCAHGRS